MSKKKLLEESTVRSFMKLANLAPLSDKFIKEEWAKEEGLQEAEHEEEEEESKVEEAKHEEEEEEDKVEESTHVMMGRGDADRMQGKGVPADRAVGEAREEEDKDEVVAEVEEMEDEAKLEEGDADGLKPLKAKMGTGGKPVQSHQGKTKATPASVSAPNQGPTKSKVPGVQGMKKIASKDPNDGKMKPLKVSTKHVSHGTPVKMNEAMEDEAGPPPEGDMPTPSDEAGESAEHQETVKGALQKMLSAMQDIAKEYGVDMAVDAGGGEEPEGGEMESPESEAPEAPPAGDEEGKMMQETLDILTKRVAARLLKRK